MKRTVMGMALLGLTTGTMAGGGGELQAGEETYTMVDAIAWTEPDPFEDGKKAIQVQLFSEAQDHAELTSQLNDRGWVSAWVPTVTVRMEPDGSCVGYNLWADNSSMSGAGGSSLDCEATVAGGRVKGTARMTEPTEAFDKEFQFNVSFDAPVLAELEGD